MTSLISAKDLRIALKLTRIHSVHDQIRKYFNDNEYKTILSGCVKLSQGRYSRHKKDFLLTKEQAAFIVSRSRGDTENASKIFNLNINQVNQILHRNEPFFLSLVDSLLTVTQLTLIRQFSCLNYNIDGAIIGSLAVLLIEYNERAHKYNVKVDDNRNNKIRSFFNAKNIDVIFVNVGDSPYEIAEGLKKISEIIHSDILDNVEYISHHEKYL